MDNTYILKDLSDCIHKLLNSKQWKRHENELVDHIVDITNESGSWAEIGDGQVTELLYALANLYNKK